MTTDRSTCTRPRHGTVSAYRQGCRCDDTREANRLYVKRHAHGLNIPQYIDSLGTSRRLRALSAIGWSLVELADHLGTTREAVQQWRSQRTPRVHRRTAATVAAVYERLSGTPGPSVNTRDRAATRGWPPPLLWDDIDIDNPNHYPTADPAPSVQRSRIDPDDIHHLRSFGITMPVIAERLGVETASIERQLDRLRRREAA